MVDALEDIVLDLDDRPRHDGLTVLECVFGGGRLRLVGRLHQLGPERIDPVVVDLSLDDVARVEDQVAWGYRDGARRHSDMERAWRRGQLDSTAWRFRFSVGPPSAPEFHDSVIVAVSGADGVLRISIEIEGDPGTLACHGVSDDVVALWEGRLEEFADASVLSLDEVSNGVRFLVMWERYQPPSERFEEVVVPCSAAIWTGAARHTIFDGHADAGGRS